VADRRPVQVLVIERPQVARLVDDEEPAPEGGQFRVETLYSGLSAGTELTWFKGTNPYLHAAWDSRLGVFHHDRPATGFPVRAPGYMEVGRVTERVREREVGSPGEQLVHRRVCGAHRRDLLVGRERPEPAVRRIVVRSAADDVPSSRASARKVALRLKSVTTP